MWWIKVRNFNKKLLEKQTYEQYSGKCILLLATPDQQKKCHKSWQIHLWSTRPNNVLVSFKVVNIQQQDAGRDLKSHMHQSGQSKIMTVILFYYVITDPYRKLYSMSGHYW